MNSEMAKKILALDDRVIEYDENSLTCMSPKFKSFFPIPWMDLVNHMTCYKIDASHVGSERLDPYITAIEKELRFFGFSEEDIFEYNVCISEAIHNAQGHTLNKQPGEKVSLSLFLKDKLSFARITSMGEPYNFEKAVESVRTLHENLLKESGRGTYIMATLCDFFHVEAEGNETEVFLGKIASGAVLGDNLYAL